MKVLCKKDVCGVDCEKLYWSKYETYFFEENDFLLKIETNFKDYRHTFEKHPIRIDNKIEMVKSLRFEEYFYTPEETKNILRIGLIDKILCEKNNI